MSIWLRQVFCRHRWEDRVCQFVKPLGSWVANQECVKCGKVRRRIVWP